MSKGKWGSRALNIQAEGFGTLQKRLEKLIRQTILDVAAEVMKQGADDTMFVAMQMAPIKSRSLEQAIEIKPGRKRDGFSVWSEVWVRPSAWNSEEGIKVGEYAQEAHDNITPAGHKKLGPFSKEKNSQRQYQVGGGFMDRALEVTKPIILNQLTQQLNQALLALNRK